MFELTPGSIRAIQLLMESLAWSSFIILGNVESVVQLVLAVSEGATIPKNAVSCQLPILANFSFILGLEPLDVLSQVLFILEYFLWFFNGHIILVNHILIIFWEEGGGSTCILRFLI